MAVTSLLGQILGGSAITGWTSTASTSSPTFSFGMSAARYTGPVLKPVTIKVGDVFHVPEDGFFVLEVGEYVQDNSPYNQQRAAQQAQNQLQNQYGAIGHGNPLHQLGNSTINTVNTFLNAGTQTAITPTWTLPANTTYQPTATSITYQYYAPQPSPQYYTTYQHASWANKRPTEDDGDWFELVSCKEKWGNMTGVILSLKTGKLMEDVYLGGISKDKFMTEVNNATKEEECPKAQ